MIRRPLKKVLATFMRERAYANECNKMSLYFFTTILLLFLSSSRFTIGHIVEFWMCKAIIILSNLRYIERCRKSCKTTIKIDTFNFQKFFSVKHPKYSANKQSKIAPIAVIYYIDEIIKKRSY